MRDHPKLRAFELADEGVGRVTSRGVGDSLVTFYEILMLDDLVKSHPEDGKVKSSRCKARKT